MGRDKKHKPKNPKKYVQRNSGDNSERAKFSVSSFKQMDDQLEELIRAIHLSDPGLPNFTAEAVKKIGMSSLESILKTTRNKVILGIFAEENDWNIKSHIASNENTPDAVLDRLARQIPHLECLVAKNSGTSTITLLSIRYYGDSTEARQYAAKQLEVREIAIEDRGITAYF